MPSTAQGVQGVRRFIAANVRRLRAKSRLSQEELAEAAELSLTFLQRIERAETNLSVDALAQIAAALSVDPRALLRPATMRKIGRGRPKVRARS